MGAIRIVELVLLKKPPESFTEVKPLFLLR